MFKQYLFISWLTNLCEKQLGEHDIEEALAHVTAMTVADTKAAADVDDLLKAMKNGLKIEAIRAYRSLTKMGLKESKDAVEKYWTFAGGHPIMRY